jgi:outer membrane protein, heavy metal efflux system
MRTWPFAILAFHGMACASTPRTAHSALAAQPPPQHPWKPAFVFRGKIAAGHAGSVTIDGRDGLSPDEAALMAIDRSPRLRALRAQRGVAQAEVVAAGLLPNPRLTGSLDFPIDEGEYVIGYGGGISWNISPLLFRGARIHAAESAAVVVDFEIAWQEWQVAQSARRAAAIVAYLSRRVALAKEIETTWKKKLAAARTALERSAVTALEVESATRALADAELARLALERELLRERANLNLAIGLIATDQVPIDASWRLVRRAPRAEALLATLRERRLDLVALQHGRRSHDQELRAALISQFPPLELGVHASRDVEDVRAAGLDVTVELPLFDRKQGDVARARAERGQVEAEYEARLAEARVEILRLSAEVVIVLNELETAARAREAAVRLAGLGAQAAASGAVTRLALTDLEERAFSARSRELEIEQSLVELQIALESVSGTLVAP